MNLNNPKCKGCNPEQLYFITFLTGMKKLDPIEYRIVFNEVKFKTWYGGEKIYYEWYVESDYMKLGPFNTQQEARAWKNMFETQR